MNILVSNEFERHFKKLPKDLKLMAYDKSAIFLVDHFHASLKTHKLKGELEGYYSFSINNKYRIVFKFEGKDSVRFCRIGTHDIYE